MYVLLSCWLPNLTPRGKEPMRNYLVTDIQASCHIVSVCVCVLISCDRSHVHEITVHSTCVHKCTCVFVCVCVLVCMFAVCIITINPNLVVCTIKIVDSNWPYEIPKNLAFHKSDWLTCSLLFAWTANLKFTVPQPLLWHMLIHCSYKHCHGNE